MVKLFQLDCNSMMTRELLHIYLQQTLSLPNHYGRNLDALFDCLTEISQPTRLEIINQNGLIPLGQYGEALMTVFRDAALENPNLELIFSA